MILASGVAFLAGEPGAERVLLLRRTDGGEWSTPGGRIEDGETALEAAEREAAEELGSLPQYRIDPEPFARTQRDGVDYRTYAARVAEEFAPTLNGEHDAFRWLPLGPAVAELEDTGAIADSMTEAPWPVGDAALPDGVTLKRTDTLPDRAAGRYDPETKTVSVARYLELGDGTRRVLANPERLLAHELGHARDHALNWASNDDAFKALLAAAWERLDALERLGAEYYLSDPGEAFAEALAFADGPAEGARYFGTLDSGRVQETLGDVIEWARGKVSA